MKDLIEIINEELGINEFKSVAYHGHKFEKIIFENGDNKVIKTEETFGNGCINITYKFNKEGLTGEIEAIGKDMEELSERGYLLCIENPIIDFETYTIVIGGIINNANESLSDGYKYIMQNFDKFKETAKLYLLAGTPKNLIIGLLTGLLVMSTGETIRIQNELDKLEAEVKTEKTINDEIGLSANKREKESASFKKEQHDQLVKEVTDYIKYALNNQKYKMEDLKVNPEEFVNCAEKYGFDLSLMLAQAHLESCFGMTPRARNTNSIFSVGAYDNGKDAVKFRTQDESIENYIKTIQKYYLVDGKTVNDLLKKGGFVNYIGKRYASAQNYEANLRSVRNRVLEKCPSIQNMNDIFSKK